MTPLPDRSSSSLYLPNCPGPISYSYSSSPVKRKRYSWRSWKSTPSIATTALVILAVLCDIPSPVNPAPSSSAWSLPTLNYLFKDTKTRSQSLQYQKEQNGNHHQNGGMGGGGIHHYKTLPGGVGEGSGSSSQSSSSSASQNQLDKGNPDGKVSSTGRLISVHDIRLTDNWGWVRRGVSSTDPSQAAEQRRKLNRNNIRHSKSKHKQRHYPASLPSSTSASSLSSPSSSSSLTSKSSKKKKEPVENLLCPFDELRGPDGKCRKAPRFSLYRVGRK